MNDCLEDQTFFFVAIASIMEFVMNKESFFLEFSMLLAR